MILDNMGRQKAIAALEIYREHEKFRKQLENMQDTDDQPAKPTPAAAAAADPEPVDDGFLQVAQPEEEKKEKKQPRRRVSSTQN